ncbi:gas vesicle protein [Evansella sp. LMS18]|uniref:gas vesicle protein GvpO n=1 Tax=Evansella sp. LMS18 TaxID=2924033 RepID=UPI0020D00920|nr:gas vesicle protein GvpO [Evansella sp. LMS18]UTR09785.1 gas vesicle protein [Evansella sp. LMS18]
MKINKVMDTVTDFFKENVNAPLRFTAIEKTDEGWYLQLEVIEEKEYMQKYARDQIVGLYEVTLDDEMEVTSFKRINMRSRSMAYEEEATS